MTQASARSRSAPSFRRGCCRNWPTPPLVTFGKTLPGLRVSVLVPNLNGAEKAIEAEVDLLLVPLSASHAHSLANLRKTPDEVIAEFGRIRAARDAAGSKALLEGGIGTAFGCTLQGKVAMSEVLRCMQGLLDAGADRVSIADTVGYAGPSDVRELFEAAQKIAGDRCWCGHFHDTRGLALTQGGLARRLRPLALVYQLAQLLVPIAGPVDLKDRAATIDSHVEVSHLVDHHLPEP